VIPAASTASANEEMRRAFLQSKLLPLAVIGFFISLPIGIQADDSQATVLFRGIRDTQLGVHRKGNVYAPDVHFRDGRYLMWFGGQGSDGHDRIHLATSRDGKAWDQQSVVLEEPSANHVNDPSVVYARGTWWMFYTIARVDVIDEIAVATSADGIKWDQRRTVLTPEKPPAWDSLLVGRPSVLYEGGTFKMWYDGSDALPLNAPAKNVAKSAGATRGVGYAESKDGLTWERKTAAPLLSGVTAVHVTRLGKNFVMVYESRSGTQCAASKDGLSWRRGGTLALARSDSAFSKFGHVTPFLFLGENGKPTLYFGAASARTWDQNCIAMMPLSDAMIKQINSALSDEP
jgi:hypothetical protein